MRLLILFLGTLVASAETRPNIIFMLSDDQHWNETSVQMHPKVATSKSKGYQTPHLEQLAAAGMRFSAAYAPAPVCAPTRFSILTGQSPAKLNWTKAGPSMTASANQKLIPPVLKRQISGQQSFPTLLQKAGYATAHYGKWHLGSGGPEKHGFDESDGDLGNEAATQFKDPNPVDIFGMSQRAIDFMKKSKEAGSPFYVQLSYLALHAPENASQKNLAKFKALGNYGRERELQRQALTADLDEGVGTVLQAIKELGLAENTYVIYMSDNGARSMTDSPISGNKGSLGEGGVRAIFIAQGPEIEANSWSHERVVGYDLFPTFCALAGIKNNLPADLSGGDFSPILHGQSAPIKRAAEAITFHFPHYQSTTPVSSIYSGDYKLLYYYETTKVELYDITTDLAESNNLSQEKPELATKMLGLLISQLEAEGAKFPIKNVSYDPSKPSQSGRGKKGGRGAGGGGRKRP